MISNHDSGKSNDGQLNQQIVEKAISALGIGSELGTVSVSDQSSSSKGQCDGSELSSLETVEIKDGKIEGVISDSITSFKGIPYAVPPVGPLRWRVPQPVTPWEGVFQAHAFSTDCLQAPGTENIQTSPSEDCLCLNIWRPTSTPANAALPVLFWIHGGGYVGGGSSIPVYDGSSFASQGMVVVSINYRLGRTGFFAHPALIEAAEGYVGNYGLFDQIQALDWVQGNIAAFGGDPTRVTIVGESAGGASVVHLMTSPIVGDHLFHQAVVLSGGGRKALLSRPMEEDALLRFSAPMVDATFAMAHGVFGRGSSALESLRKLDPDVLEGGENLARLTAIVLLNGSLTGVPVIDGEVIAGHPEKQFLDGTAKHIPTLIGSTALDVPSTFPPNKVEPFDWFGEDADAARAAYGVSNKDLLDPEKHIKALLAMGADMTMHEPAHFIASTMKSAGQSAWVYRFTYTAGSTRPGLGGQTHSGELPFMFNTLNVRYGDAVTQTDQEVADAFHTYIGNFVRNGDPNGGTLTHWPQVKPGEYDVMNFTLDDGPVYGPDPRQGVPLVAEELRRQGRQLS